MELRPRSSFLDTVPHLARLNVGKGWSKVLATRAERFYRTLPNNLFCFVLVMHLISLYFIHKQSPLNLSFSGGILCLTFQSTSFFNQRLVNNRRTKFQHFSASFPIFNHFSPQRCACLILYGTSAGLVPMDSLMITNGRIRSIEPH